MKRISTIIVSASILATAFLSSNVFAGIDYTRYRDSFEAQKNTKTSTEEGKQFQHKSKYQREQPSDGNTLPSNEREVNQPKSKYERPEWSK